MNNMKIYCSALISLVALATTSCDLDEYNPAAGTGGDKLATIEGLQGLQTYCYEPLYGQLFSAFDYFAVAEGGTDLFITSCNRTWGADIFYYEGLTTGSNYTNKLFKQAYSLINSCNSVINNADRVVDATDEQIAVLVAEAKCLRAYYYYILVTNYGNVTLKLTSSEKETNVTPERSTYQAIYAQMIQDLKDAAENLPVDPYNGQYARVTRKSALGLLARVYAQGAGEGLSEDGVSFWQRAKAVAEDLIDNMDAYGAFLYDNVDDLWAQANNRNNPEALFIAAGHDMLGSSIPSAGYSESNIFTYVYPDPNKLNELYTTGNKQNYLYGRVNNNILAPSKYLIDLFDAANDKRWDNSFTTAFGDQSLSQAAWGTYSSKCVVWTADMAAKYGKDPSVVGDTIYPYSDMNYTAGLKNQYPASVWPKGATSGDISSLVNVKNIYATPYPFDPDDDENRFAIYLSKDYMTAEHKALKTYFVVNIDDLFNSDGTYHEASFDGTNSYQLFPGLSKYNSNYNGCFGSNLQKKTGDVAIMRMAEVYLIAAEAEERLGNASKAAEYLNVLRRRACRNMADFDSSLRLTSASEQDVLDEYARELCGEFTRWAVLKRHHAFEAQLIKGNPRAAQAFSAKNYLRPISADFLNQIVNADNYGTNGY